MVLVWLPAVVVTLVLAVTLASRFWRPLDRRFSQVAYRLFDGASIEPDRRQERALRSAGIGTPYRLYATKTKLYGSILTLCGCVYGVYVGALVIDLLNVQTISAPVAGDIFRPLPAWMKTFSVKFAVVLLMTSIATGVVAAALVYLVNWQLPSIRADTRRRQIDAGMPRMVAFIYALSRGGMAFPDVMRILSQNRSVFGTSADEMGVAVRSIELFGEDLVTAVRNLARRTPSEQFQKFAENLTSVLQSGQNLSSFLRGEYERYREQAEEQQREILDLLATVAEIYVTVVVAGMLFLITILLVIGITSGGMLGLLRLLTYVVLPATNVVFIAYLAEVTQPLRASREQLATGEDLGAADRFGLVGDEGRSGVSAAVADGGYFTERGFAESPETKANLDRLRAYKRVRQLLVAVRDPAETLVEEPELILYVTVPLATGFIIGSLPSVFAGGFDLRVLDDVLIQSALFVLSTYAIVYEIGRRRLQELENAVPELLERLASLNEAGVAVVSSFDRVRRSDVGALDEEVERIWRDIRWGATVEGALNRFERRVETPSVTRVVTLLTNAMRASNDIGPVLRIAAEQARNDLRLKRQRRQEMFTYLVVIYVAFIVFLVVIGAINYVLVPNLPQTGAATGATAASVPGIIAIGEVDVAAYQLVFFHAALVQSTMSGLVGGQMGGGSTKDGVKHATIMLAVTYVVFLAFQGANLSGQVAAALPAWPL